MKVYISGGITGVDNYMENFITAENHLQEDYEVINPAKILFNLPASTTYSQYMTICIDLIDQSDVVCMLPEWKESKGASFEHHYAEISGKKIIYMEVQE